MVVLAIELLLPIDKKKLISFLKEEVILFI